MTKQALEACANGKMWEVYEPTPLTRKWLEENEYIDVQGKKPTNKVK